MDDLLPSYESVIRQNPWELVAPYLPSDDLCSAALVCQEWHDIFIPHLWGNPASHFGVENDIVYVALTRFKRTLFWARLCVRDLTHTLHLPPAHAELYGGPHAEWLRDCLEHLPRLQSLIVNGLPFFDHSSLLTLRHSSLWWRSTHPNAFPMFALRLLDASGCTNATSTGLSEALSHFPDLVSVDLSRTLAAKDEAVLSNLRFMRYLRVLKLRALGLKDADFAAVVSSIGIRVRSLDVSDNHLTDSSARLLLEHCIKETRIPSHAARTSLPPVESARPLGESDICRTEDLDSHLRKKLTRSFVGSLAIEDARDVGITHLYVSKNGMTVEGVSGLLRSKRLRVLDVGTLPVAFRKPAHLPSPDDEVLILPGVEKLTPILADYAAEKLVYLRVNYAVVTEDAPIDAVPSPRTELEVDKALCVPSDAHELEAVEPPLPELDSRDAVVHELPGYVIQPVELPDSSLTEASKSFSDRVDAPNSSDSIQVVKAPVIEVTPEPREIKRGPAYAPEPVLTDPLLSPISPVIDATGGLSPVSNASHEGLRSPSVHSTDAQLGTRPRNNSTYYVKDRRARLDLRQSQENCLHPGMLPKVHTLVLADVPLKTDNHQVVQRLIQFIKDCAEEAAIASLRAEHTYMLPPGRSRKVAEREYARSLFALRRVVFEMAPPQTGAKKISTSWRQYPTKSSTEDADSEAFWEAASQDFSFFGDEECGLPNAEPGRHLLLAAMSGLMLAPKKPAPTPKPFQSQPTIRPAFDVVAEIAKFRKERKEVYQAKMQLGEVDSIVEGYWPGDITVVRKYTGDLDYYGNGYESGWLYR